jgi:hypothetical protein
VVAVPTGLNLTALEKFKFSDRFQIFHENHKKLLDDLKKARRYWKLKEDAQDRTLWTSQFGKGYGPVTRQAATGVDCFSTFKVAWV